MLIMSQPPTVGDIIHEMYLKPSGLSVQDGAKLCELTEQEFIAILDSELTLGYELAYKLAKGFSTSHDFWLILQQDSQKEPERMGYERQSKSTLYKTQQDVSLSRC